MADSTVASLAAGMVSLRSALLLLLATPPTAFAWHIIFYPPPSPPPVSPAIAWYCPAFLTTVWALYPGGAEIEYHTIPFLPNGYMDVRLQSGMRFSRIWDASVATDVQVWNDELGAGTVRLGPVPMSHESWRAVLTTERTDGASLNYGIIDSTRCGSSPTRMRLCDESSIYYENGPNRLTCRRDHFNQPQRKLSTRW